MIPLAKLSRLPRHQRLRKAARIAGDAERRLLALGRMAPEEAAYLGDLADMLAYDEAFSPAATDALKTASASFKKPTVIAETRRAINAMHHLLLAETGRFAADWDFMESGGALDPSKRHPFSGMQAYLEDIRSPFNVGAMFRAAESFGAEKLWLSPLCADPRHKRAERSAMGCVDILPWERLAPDTLNAFLSGRPVFALETGGIPIADFKFPPGGILIAGSEELGVSPPALEAADASLGRVTIPAWGAKASLNVAVAFGIAMNAWAAQLANR